MIGSFLYVVGGRTDAADGSGGGGFSALDTAEKFNLTEQKWEELAEVESRLSCPRSGHSASFVDIKWCNNLEMVKEDEEDDDDEDGEGVGGGDGDDSDEEDEVEQDTKNGLVFSRSGLDYVKQ